jgi:hypothetical protein
MTAVAVTIVVVALQGCAATVLSLSGTPTPARRSSAPSVVGPVLWARLDVTEADVRAPAVYSGPFNGPLIPVGCVEGQVTGSALLTPDAGGVIGAVSLWSPLLAANRAGECSLAPESRSGALLDASGAALPVVVVATGTRTTNPPTRPFPVTVGPRPAGSSVPDPPAMLLRWTGQYCGPPPSALRVVFDTVSVDLPLAGPPPGCVNGARPNGTILLGFASDPSDLGQPLPPDRSALVAALDLPASVPAAAPSIGFQVRLTNPTDSAVSLSPCPGYSIGVRGKAYAGPPNPPGLVVSGQVQESGLLNCAQAPASIEAHKSVVFDMEFTAADAAPSIAGMEVLPNQVLSVVWMIAGVPSASGSLTTI